MTQTGSFNPLGVQVSFMKTSNLKQIIAAPFCPYPFSFRSVLLTFPSNGNFLNLNLIKHSLGGKNAQESETEYNV